MYNHIQKKILVVCGAGVATSTVVSIKIREELKKAGIQNVVVKQSSIANMPAIINQYNVLVTIANIEEEFEIKKIYGVPFLTGIGKKEAMEAVIEALELK